MTIATQTEGGKVLSIQVGAIRASSVTDTGGARDVKVTVRYDGRQFRGSCAGPRVGLSNLIGGLNREEE